MDCDADFFEYKPTEFVSVDDYALTTFLPDKSAKKYEKTYEKFMRWADTNNIVDYTENVFVAYFSEAAKIFKSPTLWSLYSMLKLTFSIKHNVDLSRFTKLSAFIKKQNVGYVPKKSAVFTRDEIYAFLEKAPNDIHLMRKVCLIIGVAGACRIDEIKRLTIDDVQVKGNVLVIKIPNSKSKKIRTFTVTNGVNENINVVDLYVQYLSLRPTHTRHKSLFVFYRSGRCSTQPVGIHTFGKMPSLIASYLKLHNPSAYTGHAFRRTSASLLAESGRIF